MGLFSSLFGSNNNQSKKTNQPKVTVSISTQNTTEYSPYTKADTPTPPSSTVLTLSQRLILLYLAEKYKVNETKYPEYLSTMYGIVLPSSKYSELCKNGLIRKSTNHEGLIHLKGSDLKTIASDFGLKVSGKKEDLCLNIKNNVSNDDLNKYGIDEYWVLTDLGKAELNANPYIELFVGQHKYSLYDANISVEEISKSAQGLSMPRCRDLIWGEFNRRIMEYYKKAVETNNFKTYCNLLRAMALFLEEEKKYETALDQYMKYVFCKINIEGTIRGMMFYKATKDLDSASDIFVSNAELMPFEIGEINDLLNENDMSEENFYSFMKNCFSKESDVGLFDSKELSDYVLIAMRRDIQTLKNIYKTTFNAKILKRK